MSWTLPRLYQPRGHRGDASLQSHTPKTSSALRVTARGLESRWSGDADHGQEMLMPRPGGGGDLSSLGTRATEEAEAALGHRCPRLLRPVPVHFSPRKPRAAPAAPTSPPQSRSTPGPASPVRPGAPSSQPAPLSPQPSGTTGKGRPPPGQAQGAGAGSPPAGP